MSNNFRFNLLDLRNVVIHALMIAIAFIVLFVLGGINTEAFGPYQATATVAIASAMNIVKRWYQDNTI